MDRALKRLDSLTIASDIGKLSPADEVRLQSCLDEIHNVVGDSIPELVIKSAILQHNFCMEKALDACLNGTVSVGGKPNIFLSARRLMLVRKNKMFFLL